MASPRRFRTAWLSGACACAALVLAAPARAQTPVEVPATFDGARHLAADKPAAHLVVRPLEVADAFALVDLVAGVYPALAAEVGRVRTGLDLTAWNRAELAERGVDAEAPVLAALGERAGGLIRHRFVVRGTGEGVRLVRYLGEVLARLGYEVVDVEAPGRKPPRWWAPLRMGARRAGVLVAAASPSDGAFVTVRRQGVHAVLDLAWRYGTTAGKPEPAVKTLGRTSAWLLAPPPARASTDVTLWDAFGEGSRRMLLDDGSVGLSVNPAALARLLPDGACRSALEPADGAYFSDAAVSVRLRPFEWRVRFAFAPTEAGRTALGNVGADDGLLDVRGLAASGLAAAALHLPSAASLHAVARPRALRGPLSGVLDGIGRCGPLGVALVASRTWPHLADAAVEELSTRLEINGTVPGARNLAVASRAAEGRELAFDATWATSLPAASARDMERALGRLAEGPPERASFGDRSPTLYALGKAATYRAAGLEPLPGDRLSLAVTSGERGLGWYYGHKRRPAVFGSRTRLGTVAVNVGALLEHEGQDADGATLAAVRLAAQQLGMLGGDVEMDGDLLRVDLSLGAAP